MMLRTLCLLCVLHGVNGYTCSAATELFSTSAANTCPASMIGNTGVALGNPYFSLQYCSGANNTMISWYASADSNGDIDGYMYCCGPTGYNPNTGSSYCYFAKFNLVPTLHQPIGPYDTTNQYTHANYDQYSGYALGANFSPYGFSGFTAYYTSTGSSSRIVGISIYSIATVVFRDRFPRSRAERVSTGGLEQHRNNDGVQYCFFVDQLLPSRGQARRVST